MTEVVYFLSDGGSLIKVGRSKSLDFRIETLQREVGTALTLIGTVDGGSRLEAQIHRQIKVHRARGEWFQDCPDVRSVIDEYLCGSMGPEIPSRDWSSYQPVEINLRFDPAKLERDLATLAALTAERIGLEHQVSALEAKLGITSSEKPVL